MANSLGTSYPSSLIGGEFKDTLKRDHWEPKEEIFRENVISLT